MRIAFSATDATTNAWTLDTLPVRSSCRSACLLLLRLLNGFLLLGPQSSRHYAFRYVHLEVCAAFAPVVCGGLQSVEERKIINLLDSPPGNYTFIWSSACLLFELLLTRPQSIVERISLSVCKVGDLLSCLSWIFSISLAHTTKCMCRLFPQLFFKERLFIRSLLLLFCVQWNDFWATRHSHSIRRIVVDLIYFPCVHVLVIVSLSLLQ